MPSATVHETDCLNWTRSQPDNSVDQVVCSPPYEDARTYGINFALKGQAWVDWAVERFVDQVRICRGMVVWVIEGKTRNFRWSATPALLTLEPGKVHSMSQSTYDAWKTASPYEESREDREYRQRCEELDETAERLGEAGLCVNQDADYLGVQFQAKSVEGAEAEWLQGAATLFAALGGGREVVEIGGKLFCVRCEEVRHG